MVLFSILFIEPYYSSPKNVITNTIPLLLVLLSIENNFDNKVFWWLAIVILLLLLTLSIIALSLVDKNKSPEHWKNRCSDTIKKWVVLLGQGKILYSSVFIYFLLTYYSIQNYHTLILFVLWFFILMIDPKKIKSTFAITDKKYDESAIGEIFGVQSKKIFLVKLFEDKKTIQKFDVVKFRYSMQDTYDLAITGIVFDTYLLNQEKWTKILQLGYPQKPKNIFEKNVIYKVLDKDEKNKIDNDLNINNFVGIIIEDSGIGKIKFEYSKKKDDLQEGDLLELEVDNKRLFYQVISGFTEKEKLEARNETGFIKGEAIQLGEWLNDELSFRKFGWVPSINTAIYKADTKNIIFKDFRYPEFKLGVIPSTTLPSVINLDDAISHHLALLGVTGSGKSFLARDIIKQLQQDTKIICVDFTGEWKRDILDLKPVDLIDSSKLDVVEENIAKKEKEASSRNSDKTKILEYKRIINNKLLEYVKDFIESKNMIALFELPELSNTMFILEFTQLFLDSVFSYARKNLGQKICIVLEEAHTIIPETNFLGDLGDYGSSKALVSKMSQIALQGRKYGVGLLILAQRTANVSKTVLTQCNTVICFQAFDETSFNFLGNYIGRDLVQTLPNLKQYHAIVTGKAIKSNLPMIIDLKRENAK
jgi:predicted house-cleaning noncanonical NTP pyrophosphatase (MazG superfamily)